MNNKKPEPIFSATARNHCPVCGKVSYSLSGEHPQCALTRADTVFRLKQKKRNERKAALVAQPK